MTLDLSNCRAKLEWAEKHIESIHSEIRPLMDPEKTPFLMGGKFEAQGPNDGVYIFVVERLPTVPSHLGLMVGDALHNLRSALDHLAWELVQRGADQNPKRPNDVMFPTYSTLGGFAGNLKRRLPGVGKTEWAIIERYQPYHRIEEPMARDVELLAEFSNTDKHRLIHPVLLGTGSADFGFIPIKCEILGLWVAGIPNLVSSTVGGLPIMDPAQTPPPLPVVPPELKVGAPLFALRVRFANGADHYMSMKGTVFPFVAIGNAEHLQDRLDSMAKTVGAILALFA
jgi:hypothetical protein